MSDAEAYATRARIAMIHNIKAHSTVVLTDDEALALAGLAALPAARTPRPGVEEVAHFNQIVGKLATWCAHAKSGWCYPLEHSDANALVNGIAALFPAEPGE